MKKSLNQYGQLLHLLGGNLIYMSKTIYPTYINGLICNPEQYRIDLKNLISVGQSSVQSLETTTPPLFLHAEHWLFLKLFKEMSKCLTNLSCKIDEYIP